MRQTGEYQQKKNPETVAVSGFLKFLMRSRLSLGELSELKTCRWHVFSSDRSGYAARTPQFEKSTESRSGFRDGKSRKDNYLLEFLHWCFIAFYIVDNAHIVGYCESIIAYRLIFFVLSHRMLHQISTKLTPRLTPVLLDKLELVKYFLLDAVQYILVCR